MPLCVRYVCLREDRLKTCLLFIYCGAACASASIRRMSACFTLQCVRRGLRQCAAVRLDQWTADGDQWTSSIHQRRLQWRHVIELDRGQAANEALRSRLRDFLIEVLPPYRKSRIYVVTDGDGFWVVKSRMTKQRWRGKAARLEQKDNRGMRWEFSNNFLSITGGLTGDFAQCQGSD